MAELRELTPFLPLFLVQAIWMLLLAIAIFLAGAKERGRGAKRIGRLSLPHGSIRGILALLVVGSFLNVIIFGSVALADVFNSILAALGTLAGSVLGFYFGNLARQRHFEESSERLEG